MENKKEKTVKDNVYYVNKFKELYNNNPVIVNKDNEELALKDNEIFIQCWSDTPTRKGFSKKLFVSQYGNIISVRKDSLRWDSTYKRYDSERRCFKPKIKNDDGKWVTKNVQLHALIALSFESEIFGRAEGLLDEKGLYAFGVKDKDRLCVQVHHKDGNPLNNDPGNLEAVTWLVHDLFDRVPKADAGLEENIRFMQEFSRLMKEENPETPTILYAETYDKNTGEILNEKHRSIQAMKPLSEEAIKALNEELAKMKITKIVK